MKEKLELNLIIKKKGSAIMKRSQRKPREGYGHKESSKPLDPIKSVTAGYDHQL